MMLIIMSIAVIFDITEKVEDFQKVSSINEIIFDYYLNFVAFYGNMFSAMIVFISTILFTSKMSSNTEIVASLTGGVSYKRLMLPFFIGATIIFTLSFVANHYIIPTTNIKRLQFENAYVGAGRKLADNQNIHRQVAPGELVYFENFSPTRKTGYNFSYEKFTEDLELRYKLTGNYIRFDTATDSWKIDQWVLRTIDENGAETISRGRRKDTTFVFGPDELVPKLFSSAMMITPVLKDFIKAEKQRGSSKLNTYYIELHKRTSWPFATYVLILIAVSLSTKKSRGGLGINMAIGLFICLIYVFLMQISSTFGSVGQMSPFLAVWFPNIFFFFIGVYLYWRAPK
jgi:lipopolysaccharide export system permease protein